MIRLQFKYNPNHVKSGPNGGQFTSAPTGAVSSSVASKTRAGETTTARDPLTAKLFNGKRVTIVRGFQRGKDSPFEGNAEEYLRNHPDFGGNTREEVINNLFTKMFNTDKGHTDALIKMSGVPDGGLLQWYVSIQKFKKESPHIALMLINGGLADPKEKAKKISAISVIHLKKHFSSDNQDRGKESGFPMDSLKEGEYHTTLENVKILFSPRMTGKGIGTRIIAQQVKYAEQYNITAAYLTAIGGGLKAGRQELVGLENSGRQMVNGYYTWPRLGYEQHSTKLLKTLEKNIDSQYNFLVMKAKKDPAKIALLDAEYQKTKDIISRSGLEKGFLSSLMKTAEGRQLWKDYGHEVELYFDMRKGSPQKAVLAAYLAEKGIVV
ncbi:hypothetical protein UFOVP967_32 [uncultured Caudovirales phage]|uniref:N-acetyltransferase domain-containing protein n=1 Tax=uncultured Caudovirales phage TaxID=2100421 RepID=A0A6J5SX57_9CAUD|nr:hypothetical protein UFOVP521_84 [uncultured Caudovirales phage]CAB4167775.1 hypothetical protein UFOVP856_56 [uncultured Caudovirales phage]CAB4174200.1 hypothetical protein UFOVP967_32 [uncultured Caudovirales phage]CAB4180549.1 hypothetical protein UFOVP1036_49 [uncultured Caudovirales phage]CAB4186144.1 hypothetical protein UFOVP1132_18 [uncultured Caudovirales phage]